MGKEKDARRGNTRRMRSLPEAEARLWPMCEGLDGSCDKLRRDPRPELILPRAESRVLPSKPGRLFAYPHVSVVESIVFRECRSSWSRSIDFRPRKMSLPLCGLGWSIVMRVDRHAGLSFLSDRRCLIYVNGRALRTFWIWWQWRANGIFMQVTSEASQISFLPRTLFDKPWIDISFT